MRANGTKKIRVLVVDDDDLIAAMMTAILQSVGIQYIDIAVDGLKGISMLYDANPVYNLVLRDWNMPIKNVLDVHNASGGFCITQTVFSFCGEILR